MNEINYILHEIAIASANESVRGTDSFFFSFFATGHSLPDDTTATV